ncbi:kelch domain-containing protein 1 isoform X2 [Pseudorasbora parva]|uniref:kelch domain-containing protein 1 isoform X2 n=1 Tax=Pseudorasbora parva TaxID=51549 RepID=UPI00351F3C19
MGDVVARERSGHTAAADGQYLYVWGGYVSVAGQEVFLPSDELWLYDLETGLWLRRGTAGTIPMPMSGSCGCIVSGHLYIFGGCGEDGQTNEHYSLSLHDETFSWRRVRSQSGSPPSPRDKLSCWVHKGRMIYFGGYGHKRRSDIRDPESFAVDEASWDEDIFWGWNNETHEFDPERGRWIEPLTSETRTCDVFCLDLNSWTWSEIVSSSAAPPGRSWHTLTSVSDSSLFMFGGLSVDCRPLSEGWIFNLETKEWTRTEHPHKDKPRLWHSACQGRDSDVIVFGGSHDYILLEDKGHCNDALVFQTQPYPLIRLCQDFISSRAGVFQLQILCLPPKLRRAVETRRKTQNTHTTAE